MNDIPRLSEAVYVGLCHEVGSPTEVRMRREVEDTDEIIKNTIFQKIGVGRMKKGRKTEIFRVQTSNFFFIMWFFHHKVICDRSQISLYRISEHTVILMDCDDLTPGSTRLHLIKPVNDEIISLSLEEINKKLYISSTLFFNNSLRFFQSVGIQYTPSIPHRPCSSFLLNYIEFCFRSHHWPTNALSWIERCCEQGWPSEAVLTDILSTGFHVVPICSSSEIGIEWKISFSLAEQKLLCSMNHCQFLCYAILTIVLEEIINFHDTAPVLSSYFITTIVFWAIQTNRSLAWTPDNLLSCFWECFKLLICWVRIGECPNFFIPQNNMFRLEVVGSVQTFLFNQLYDLYRRGISCLLFSKTLRPYLSYSILNKTLRVCTDENSKVSSTELDILLCRELRPRISTNLRLDFVEFMKQAEKMIRQRLTPYQAVTLQCMTSDMFRTTAMLLTCNIIPNKYRNRRYYKANKVSGLLKLGCKIGLVSEIQYLAMHYYKTRRYEYSLSCLLKAQQKMSLPYIIMNNEYVNVDMYRHCMDGMSPGNKIKRALVTDIVLDSELTYIDELDFEQKIALKNGMTLIVIPPHVLLHMLFILNHNQLGNTVITQKYARDLHALLLYDEGVYVDIKLRDISWQILGICQQIIGDYIGSLQSYKYSLQQYPIHNIQEATMLRINTLIHGAV